MNKIKLMTHVVVGYPNMEESEKLIKILAEQSDFLEIQIPFSDPIADGETIMKASEIALKNGMNTDKAFEMILNIQRYFAEVARKFFPFQREPETSGTQKFS